MGLGEWEQTTDTTVNTDSVNNTGPLVETFADGNFKKITVKGKLSLGVKFLGVPVSKSNDYKMTVVYNASTGDVKVLQSTFELDD